MTTIPGSAAPGTRAGSHHTRLITPALALLGVATACEIRVDTDRRGNTRGSAAGALATGGKGETGVNDRLRDSVPPHMMSWDVAAVEARLRNSGFAPRRFAREVRQSFMSVPGVVLTVGGAELQLYVYGDVAARSADTDRLEAGRVAPPATEVEWRMPPTLVTNANLAAVILTHDDAVRARLLDALAAPRVDGAGGPQSKSPSPDSAPAAAQSQRAR